MPTLPHSLLFFTFKLSEISQKKTDFSGTEAGIKLSFMTQRLQNKGKYVTESK